MIFNESFKGDEGFFDMGLLLERIKASISSIGINKDEVILEVING